jgi:peptidoglycan/LPS O-acetylase OafA/YrhL
MGVTPVSQSTPPDRPLRLLWLDTLKGLAIIWLFVNHLSEKVFGGPYLANPSQGWPSLRERALQLLPVRGHGIGDVPLNALRYLGWGGDMAGVQLFLIASGFGLAWSFVNKSSSERLDPATFYRRRLLRIYPEWITAHVLLAAAGTLSLAPTGASFLRFNFWLSLVGIRIRAADLYAFSPAWWFFGLLIQLYLLFPILRLASQTMGPGRLFTATCIVAFSARGLGLALFDGYLDAWSRGAVFVSQLPSFVLGMALAEWLKRYPVAFARAANRFVLVLLGLFVYLVGNALGLTLLGMAVAPFVIGLGAFVALWPLIARESGSSAQGRTFLGWVGRHSFSIFLVHHLVVERFGPNAPDVGPGRFLFRTALTLVGTIVGALLLERVAKLATRVLGGLVGHFGWRRMIAYAAVSGVLLVAILLSLEIYVRRNDPQEVYGWGELASLQPSDEFGWHLKPSRVTRLRWLSYDYTVRANKLGFPGPEYDAIRRSGTFRILVTGDAYSSAEGVDTEQAWPRVLERELKDLLPTKAPEVLNFAITGYGPTQDAAIVHRFVPQYRPDLVIVEMFLNDFDDELLGNSIRDGIGFSNPHAQTGLKGILKLAHLGAWTDQHVSLARQAITGVPSGEASFFSGLTWLKTSGAVFQSDVQARVKTRLQQMHETVAQKQGRLLVLLVPAALQVCDIGDLPYLSHAKVPLSQLDMDGPQRIVAQLCSELGIDFIDLRQALRGPRCLYQPHNLHWLADAHVQVARYLAEHTRALATR